jgi:hypothetical protein
MRKYMKTSDDGTMKDLVMGLFMTVRLRRSLLLLLALTCSSVYADDPTAVDYQPGHGWQVPGTGFRLGGYASASFENNKHQPWTLGADDLSLFIRWEGEGKLRFFSEFDLEDPLKLEQGHELTTRHAYLALERFYADYLYSEKLNLRAGKFLTPIGRWNLIHAAPLEWTTSRPLITEHSFPTNATGAMIYGTVPLLGRDIDYSLYTALGEDWRPDPKLDPFEGAFGLHVTLPLSDASEFGVSLANFEQKGSVGERKNLLGLDYLWTRNRYEISSELVYRFSDEGSRHDERGLFIQGVMPLSERWYGIGRYELYDQAGPAPAMNLGVVGLAMKLSPALIFKAEYSHASKNRIQVPEGLFTSFAILF